MCVLQHLAERFPLLPMLTVLDAEAKFIQADVDHSGVSRRHTERRFKAPMSATRSCENHVSGTMSCVRTHSFLANNSAYPQKLSIKLQQNP